MAMNLAEKEVEQELENGPPMVLNFDDAHAEVYFNGLVQGPADSTTPAASVAFAVAQA